MAVSLVSAGTLAVGLAADSALQHYSHNKLERLLGEGERLNAISQRLKEFDRFVRALALFNSLSAIFLVATILVLQTSLTWGRDAGTILLLAIGIPLGFYGLVHSVVETIAERCLVLLIGFISLVGRLMHPLVVVIDAVARQIGRPLGASVGVSQEEDAVEEFLDAVAEGEAGGAIEEAAADIIENIIEFKDLVVREVMTPRTSMVCARMDMSFDEIVGLLNEHSHSRLPIYRGNRDNVIGVLYMKDVLRHYAEVQAGKLDFKAIMRRPLFVPETKKISDLLTEFRLQKMQIAVVLDEFGGTSGLVTVEDILEEIVGEIDDEFDDGQGESEITRLDEYNVEFDAKLAIDDLNDNLDVPVELPVNEDYDTVGGFLSAKLGKVPATGETYEIDGACFEVTEADERKVIRVRVTTTPTPTPIEPAKTDT